MTRNILILGGTYDARMIAERAAQQVGKNVIYSLAGRTHDPLLPACSIRRGGFGGVAGLMQFLEEMSIDAVIDATHPFAAHMSRNAAEACKRTGTACVAFGRPSWLPQAHDQWYEVADLPACALLAREVGTRIFLTIGRQGLAHFSGIADRWFLIRSIERPEAPLPPLHDMVLARGPFVYADELRVLREARIDVIVTKNSGGKAAYAKIEAARELGIPVILLTPQPLPHAVIYSEYDEVLSWLERVIFAWP